MAIIHMESSRKPTNFTRDSFHKLSALSNYRRHLHKMALTCLDLTLIVTEFLSQILCKLESRRYPTIGVNQLSASLTQNGAWPLGLNYKNTFSQILWNNRIGDNQLSALLNYRRYSTIGVTYKRWRILAWTQLWNWQNFSRKFSAHQSSVRILQAPDYFTKSLLMLNLIIRRQ